jgi:hypothetical protein
MINGVPLDYILSKNNINPEEISYDDQWSSDTSYRNYHIYVDYPAWEAESTDSSSRSWTSRRSVIQAPHKILIINSNDVLNPKVLVN